MDEMILQRFSAAVSSPGEDCQHEQAQQGGFWDKDYRSPGGINPWRRKWRAEIGCDRVEIQRVDDAVVIEIRIGPELARLIEVLSELGEVDGVHLGVEVGISRQHVAQIDRGGIEPNS